MANKGKIRNCPAKESLDRINYLYQVANETLTKNQSSHIASVMYSNLLIAISKKAVQRLDVEVKRTICKGCRCLLLAGVNCRVKIKKKQARYTCLNCHTVKVFNVKSKNHQLWSQKPENLVEILDYNTN